MNVSGTFIVRPIATSLMMIALFLGGLTAFDHLAVSALPEVDYPTIQVTTGYPGASADVMASAVTAPLERQLGEVPGLAQMQSTSSDGISVITLQFTLTEKLDVAQEDVQAAINAASSYLPPDLPTPPVYNKVNPADAPILTLALTSTSVPVAQMEDAADTRLAQNLSQVSGVGLVTVAGGHKPAINIDANPAALARSNLSLEDVRNTVSNATVNRPKGSFSGATQAYSVTANDQILRAQDYSALVVAYKNGAPVQLSQIADVRNGYENEFESAWLNTTPAVILNVRRQPGVNIISVVDSIQKLLPQLRSTLPAGTSLQVVTDRTTTIRASVRDVEFELMLTIALVVLVIFVFLGSVSATIIPAVAVPLSLVGTFGVMQFLGYSLNNLTLMALTISTGFVVDDAIVMVENITRYVEEGLPPLESALRGAQQIGFTVISLTISLIAVLIPLLFMGDIVGRLFREFAVTLAITILMSAFISLTLTPMMSARLLQPMHSGRKRLAARATEAMFGKLTRLYERSLQWVLGHQVLTLLVAGSTLVITVLLYVAVPKGFFPVQDTGLVQIITEGKPGNSFAEMSREQVRLAEALLQCSDVESLTSFVGVDESNESIRTGRILVNLKPLERRRSSFKSILAELERRGSSVSGFQAYVQPVQDLTVDTHITRTQYQFTLMDPDQQRLNGATDTLLSQLRTRSELQAVVTDKPAAVPAVRIDIDRAAAGRYGVSASAVDNVLYDAYGQRQVATIFTQLNQYRVVLLVQPTFRSSPEALGNLYLPGTAGAQIPLSSFARIVETSTPLTVHRLNQFPAATFSYNLANGVSLGTAIDAVRQTVSRSRLPKAVDFSLQGTAKAFASSASNELLLILAAVLAVYIVLGVLYESYMHPLTILSTLPSAGVGALLAMMVMRIELTVIAIIGIILLIGIVKKNAIMMIDFALEAERDHGMSSEDAIYRACLLRFRPIMMTTMAALLGAVPLAFGHGVGSELRRPLGITIIGGLLISQVLTLYTTPVIYILFDRLSPKRARNAIAGAAE